MPLQVDEVLSVDCSFGSAGGRSVPSTAAAGTRHRHPWLFQLTCGEGGQIEVESSEGQSLKALEVQLVSALTGVCECSLRGSFPARRDWCNLTGKEEARWRGTSSTSNGGGVTEGGQRDNTPMDRLEHHISRLQHSIFWQEVFDTIKEEALVDGKGGWVVHQDARCGANTVGNHKAPMARAGIARIEAGAKRRLVGLTSHATRIVAPDVGARVVHVVDDEVMVEMDYQYLLGYRLVSGDAGSELSSNVTGARVASAEDDVSTKNDSSERSKGEGLAPLCQLALLYCGSLVRQQQQTKAMTLAVAAGRERERVTATSADSGAGTGTSEGPSTFSSAWKSSGSVLLHHRFRAEVTQLVRARFALCSVV